MSPETEKNIRAKLRDAYPMPTEVIRLVTTAGWDLYNGPPDDERDNDGWKYPGFAQAVDIIREWADDIPSTVWIDTFAGGVSESAPEAWLDDATGAWVEPEWSDWCQLERRDVLRLLMDRELASYI